eukprot:g3085.t1
MTVYLMVWPGVNFLNFMFVDPATLSEVLPFLKGVALGRLKCAAQAADCLEEAIAMNKGFKQAHLEFQQAAAELEDIHRCRRVAQLLVDHGGYWVNSLQRPLHFAAQPKVRSQPWYEADQFELVKALEQNYAVIKDVEYFPEGKVACHLGHLDILKKFLMQDTKSFALVFEDDLEPGPETVVPGEKNCYFAGFVGAFPSIASNSEKLTPPVNGTLDSLAQRNEELSRYLYNDVKVCAKCGRPCGNNQKACQQCGASLADVPVTQTENVMMGFIFGVERTLKLPLMISIRRQSDTQGRWFPLEYVTKILDVLVSEGQTYDVQASTSVDEIIQHFNSKGEVWAERYQTYCKSYALSNWKVEDFKYVVFQGQVHEIQEALPDGRVCLGEKLNINPVSLHHEDKLLLQNYGRRIDHDCRKFLLRFEDGGEAWNSLRKLQWRSLKASSPALREREESPDETVMDQTGFVHSFEIEEEFLRFCDSLHMRREELGDKSRGDAAYGEALSGGLVSVLIRREALPEGERDVYNRLHQRCIQEVPLAWPGWIQRAAGKSGRARPSQDLRVLQYFEKANFKAHVDSGWACQALIYLNEDFQGGYTEFPNLGARYRPRRESPWGSHKRCGAHRSQLIAESLEALSLSLCKIGSKLYVAPGAPEEVLPGLLSPGSLLIYQAEDTHDEQQVEEAVTSALSPGVDVKYHFGQTLHHRDDLGFEPWQHTAAGKALGKAGEVLLCSRHAPTCAHPFQDLKAWLPLPFGKFYHETCGQVRPRCELRTPGKGDLPPPPADDDIAGVAVVSPQATTLLEAMGTEPVLSSGDFHWKGGEDAALQQLEAYCTRGGLGSYQRTRNQLHVNCSSRLSPWMAIGCLSPRTVFWRAERFEREHGKDQGLSKNKTTKEE